MFEINIRHNFTPDKSLTVSANYLQMADRPSGHQLQIIGKVACFSRAAFVVIALGVSGAAALQLGLLPWIVLNAALIALGVLVWRISQTAVNRLNFVQFLGGAERFDQIPVYEGKDFLVETKSQYWEDLREITFEQTTLKLKPLLDPANLKSRLSLGKMDNGCLIAIMRGEVVDSLLENDLGITVEIASEDGYSTYGTRHFYDDFRCWETWRWIIGATLTASWIGFRTNANPTFPEEGETFSFTRGRTISLAKKV